MTLAGAIYSCTHAYIYVSHTSSGSSTMSLIYHRLVVNENRKHAYKYMSNTYINTNY
jgi:hypothetical protein